MRANEALESFFQILSLSGGNKLCSLDTKAILSGEMDRHCGYVDFQEICAGSPIYLTVYVEGAM